MLKVMSIAPIFASLIGAFAYQTEPELPRAAATAVQLLTTQAAEANQLLNTRASAAADTQWSDVYEVLESEVANPDARERLGALIVELETQAYAGDAGVADFNAALEATLDEFWVLTEEDALLSYAERDLVFDVLMAAIVDFPMVEETTRWVTTETLVGQKCKNRLKAECESSDAKRTCIKKKEQKKQTDGTYKDTGKVRCESGAV